MDKVLLYKALAKNGAEKSASGNPVVLTDMREGQPLKDIKVYGWSKQAQYDGKNLLKYPYIETTKTRLGITFTDNKDGSIGVKGTGTDTTYYNLYANKDGKRLTLASGTYKLVVKGRSKCNVSVNNGVNSAKNEGTFTITDGHNDVWCYIEAPKGLALDETIYPMIQLASITDESYEPYTGGKPSPSPDYPQEIKSVVNPTVKVCGKNLWDNFKTLSLGNVEQKNGTYIATTDNMQVDITEESVGARPLLLKANNAYTFSLKTTVSISSLKFVCLRYTNGEINNIIFTNKNFVNFVPKRDVEKVGFILYESVVGDKVYDVQLEMGSEATPYEPYQEEQTVTLPYTLNAIPVSSNGNVTIDGQQWIADYVNMERGKLVKIVNSLILDGDKLKFVADTTNTYWNLPQQSAVKPIGYDVLSNYFKIRVFFSNEYSNFIYTTQKNMAGLFETVDELNAFVAQKYKENDPVILYYFMREPIENDLAQEEIEALKTLKTYTGTTIVENDAECYMEVTAGGANLLRAKKIAMLLGE